MKNIKKLIMSVFVAGSIIFGVSTESHAAQMHVQLSEKAVELGNSQRVIIQLDNGQMVEKVILSYRHVETGTVFEQYADETEGGTAVFCLFFPGDALTGEYRLEKIRYQCNESAEEIVESLPKEMVFGVCGEVQPAEPATEDALDSGMSWKAEEAAYAKAKDEVIIVLDPGHDNNHAGAHQNGLQEEKLNLKIAKYCKAKLEEYYGAKVYMTRDEDGSCPHPGRTAARCNEKRVAYADSIDADIYVSLHNNSSTSASPRGAIVYYPNTNYSKSISDEGKGLARKIQDALVALGLHNNGISMKLSADYKYPDGSTADYYAIIRNSKLAGIPAIIVEHAFMSNSSDAKNFLSSDAKLKALGEADAKAIADYYGLSTEMPTPEVTMEEKQEAYVTPTVPAKPAEGQVFVDVYDDWYTEYVKYVYEKGLMSGIGETLQFRPNENVTKAQVAQVLYNMEGAPKVTDRTACTEMSDVYEDWYTDAVCWAYEKKIVTGDLNTKAFSPNANVTREQLALMLYRYACYKAYDVKQTGNLTGLKNADKLSSWAGDAVKWAIGMKLIEGVEVKNSSGSVIAYDLKPQGAATRAQLAAILTRFCKSYD